MCRTLNSSSFLYLSLQYVGILSLHYPCYSYCHLIATWNFRLPLWVYLSMTRKLTADTLWGFERAQSARISIFRVDKQSLNHTCLAKVQTLQLQSIALKSEDSNLLAAFKIPHSHSFTVTGARHGIIGLQITREALNRSLVALQRFHNFLLSNVEDLESAMIHRIRVDKQRSIAWDIGCQEHPAQMVVQV